MSHKPVFLQNVTFSLSHKICFADLNLTIHPGGKIGIAGPNGGGKSTLLAIIQGLQEPTAGKVVIAAGTTFGYVPQQPAFCEGLSGGQLFNAALTQALAADPDILCLDEPTNHLDRHNRRSLMRMLQHFDGTLLLVSHDVELLRSCVDTIWQLEHGSIEVFAGAYDDFIRAQQVAAEQKAARIKQLGVQQAHTKNELLKQRERSARRARANKNENDRNLLGLLKQSSDASLGKQLGSLEESSSALAQARAGLHEAKKIVVSFELLASHIHKGGDYVVAVRDGSVGYQNLPPLLTHINLHVGAGERVALLGDNGSGKSTLIKAMCRVQGIVVGGEWQMPQPAFIGYLDQHYKILNPALSVLEALKAVHNVQDAQLRMILNDFLFRKNEEVHALVGQLSGGEKARLALACIAVQQPSLLVLDEVTNNLDLQTREYVIQVLNQYPGSLIVISHDEDFLNRINIQERYVIDNGAAKRECAAE